jgi:hypothetical protein
VRYTGPGAFFAAKKAAADAPHYKKFMPEFSPVKATFCAAANTN